MPTLREYRIELGWTISQMAKEADVSRQVVTNAEQGKPIQASTAKSLATALSKGYDKEIKVLEIEGLNIL